VMGAQTAVVEVKNLRAHRFVEDVALRLHLDRQLKQVAGSEFTLEDLCTGFP
jgi:hypothetical protein